MHLVGWLAIALASVDAETARDVISVGRLSQGPARMTSTREEAAVSESTLDVRVEGQPGAIPARAFLDVLRTALDLLDQLERAEHAYGKLPGRWLIGELRNESATAVLRRPDAPGLQTPLRLVDGIGQLRQAEGLPAYFSPAIAEGLVRIGRQVRQEGVSGVSFRSPEEDGHAARTEQVSESVIAHALASVEGVEHAVGSVSGILDVINLRRGAHQVSLYDDATRRAVRCRFPDDLFEVMRDALGRRVRALGEVTRNRQGQILRVAIQQIELLPEVPAAPSVDELVGIADWYTGNQSTEDYLRSVRGA